MKRIKKLLIVCLCIWLTIVFSGCTAIGIDVESQLRPPKNNGEQELLQNALDTYIA